MIDERDWARIARYVTGEAAPDEALATRRWIDQNGARRDLLASLEAMWARASSPPRHWDAESAWETVRRRAPRADRVAPVRRSASGGVRVHRIVGAAAAAVVIAAGTVYLRYGLRTPEAPPNADAPRDRQYTTAVGQRAVVNLIDGTRVELGAQTTLRVAAGTGRREVYLDGEAAFTVVHDSSHAFVVHARNAIAEDLGTRFNVRAYPSDSSVRVVVMSGEVALSAEVPATAVRVLKAGDGAMVDAFGALVYTPRSDTAAAIAWSRDRFIVRETPLRDVVREIERRFDVQIELADSAIGRRRVTIDVPAARATDVLGAATVPLGLHFERSGRTIVVRRLVHHASSDSATVSRSDQ